MKIDENKIILTLNPTVQWLAGLLFSSAGLNVLFFSLFTVGGVNFTGTLLGIVFAYIGFSVALASFYQRVAIDRWFKKVTIRKIGIFYDTKNEYSSAEIEKFYCESSTDSENNNTYTVCMTLKSGLSLVLSSPFQNKADCETIIKTANAFLIQKNFPDNFQPKYL